MPSAQSNHTRRRTVTDRICIYCKHTWPYKKVKRVRCPKCRLSQKIEKTQKEDIPETGNLFDTSMDYLRNNFLNLLNSA